MYAKIVCKMAPFMQVSTNRNKQMLWLNQSNDWNWKSVAAPPTFFPKRIYVQLKCTYSLLQMEIRPETVHRIQWYRFEYETVTQYVYLSIDMSFVYVIFLLIKDTNSNCISWDATILSQQTLLHVVISNAKVIYEKTCKRFIQR